MPVALGLSGCHGCRFGDFREDSLTGRRTKEYHGLRKITEAVFLL